MILTTYQTRRRDQLNETKKSSSKSIGFRKKYRDILLFNRNLLISGTVGFFVSVLATQIIVEIDISSAFDISIVTILIGYCASKPLFIILFHRDNKQKYKKSYDRNNRFKDFGANHKTFNCRISRI